MWLSRRKILHFADSYQSLTANWWKMLSDVSFFLPKINTTWDKYQDPLKGVYSQALYNKQFLLELYIFLLLLYKITSLSSGRGARFCSSSGAEDCRAQQKSVSADLCKPSSTHNMEKTSAPSSGRLLSVPQTSQSSSAEHISPLF